MVNCWVGCSFVLDNLCYWWIQKTLSKRPLGGGIFLQFTYYWFLVQGGCCNCSCAWNSIYVSTWSWRLGWSERCGKHLHIVKLEICESCGLTCFYDNECEFIMFETSFRGWATLNTIFFLLTLNYDFFLWNLKWNILVTM